MKQFQLNYENNLRLASDLRRIKQWTSSTVSSSILFQIYSEQLKKDLIEGICDVIRTELPEAIYMGCSTNGNILMGEYCASPVSIVCTVFEYPSTKIELFQYPLDAAKEQTVVGDIIARVKERPWVKSIMMNITIRNMSMTQFCDDLSALPEGIEVFGGGAFSEDMNESAAFVFSSVGGISDHSVVFALIGGDDYYVKTNYVTGWKPLGRELLVTKTEGFVLYELDGAPAYEKYHKYLNIENDDNFFVNTLEFPFFYEHNGINILRAPIACDENGALTMTADMEQNVKARLAYGDPETILDSVRESALMLRNFAPESITVFSCAARRTFWGADEISGESMPFQLLAPTSGFYTSGEFLRTNGKVNQHNVTLVIAAQREGEKSTDKVPNVDYEKMKFSGKVSMINRLANFIQAATGELEEANKRLELAARTDVLTGVYNRGEIQRRISAAWKTHKMDPENARVCSLIMMDLDNFKMVNDKFGHKEGDTVLKGLTSMLKRESADFNKDASVGRWGGEEFMILLPGNDVNEARSLAEILRIKFSEIVFPASGKRTMSLGVTEIIPGEDSDRACMRVDGALYEAKENGKNQVVMK
ncbi:MAG: diguanylate cyclase [Lachnospiraceae bacterium]|nr:diguanylate cyclase [Lachnospiraceae bacterium]